MSSNDANQPDDGGAASAPPALVRPRRGRLRTAAGVAGLAAILGPGAYFTTIWVLGQGDEKPREVTAVGADTPRHLTSGGSAAPAPAPAAGKTGENQQVKTEPSFEEPSERVRKAREAAEKEGVKITRPLPASANPAGAAAEAAAKEVTVGSAKEGGTMRIVTVRGDLTGQRELGWVAGGIERHGDASCSQTFKLYNEQEPKVRPSLLVCWRTSEKRSVLVVDTKLGGRPSVDKSLGIIQREWRKLG